MSKRADSIRSMFAARPALELSADNPSEPRVASGSVRSMRESFTGVERENEALRAEILRGATVVDIDPTLIDPSPVADRLDADEGDEKFEALKASIAERGQEVPVLLREKPGEPGRYQSAYGHRRIRAARSLGRPVRALIKSLSEEDLVVAQGLENSAREDLTFIERASFALRLEEQGFERRVVQYALSVDKAEASKLVAVGRAVPQAVLLAIGRAPRAGRGRWQKLAEHLKEKGAMARVRHVLLAENFRTHSSDERFVLVFEAAAPPREGLASTRQSVVSISGRVFASQVEAAGETRFVINRRSEPGFADFLAAELPHLYERFVASPPDRESDP